MDLSRRDFLKLSGLTTGGMLLPQDLVASVKGQRPLGPHKPIGETPTICPFCAVGCGLLVVVIASPLHVGRRGGRTRRR